MFYPILNFQIFILILQIFHIRIYFYCPIQYFIFFNNYLIFEYFNFDNFINRLLLYFHTYIRYNLFSSNVIIFMNLRFYHFISFIVLHNFNFYLFSEDFLNCFNFNRIIVPNNFNQNYLVRLLIFNDFEYLNYFIFIFKII